jgi:hypothetical protein
MIKGEQFWLEIGGDVLYDESEQIMLVIYNSMRPDERMVFLKTPDERFPDAGIIRKVENDEYIKAKVFITPEMTLNKQNGKYVAELKQVIDGAGQPIIKCVEPVFTIQSTITD